MFPPCSFLFEMGDNYPRLPENCFDVVQLKWHGAFRP